jgi:hypothetical protein
MKRLLSVLFFIMHVLTAHSTSIVNASSVTFTQLYVWEYGTALHTDQNKHIIDAENLLTEPFTGSSVKKINQLMKKGKKYDLLLLDTTSYAADGSYKLVMCYSIDRGIDKITVQDKDIIEDHSFDPVLAKVRRGNSYFTFSIENHSDARLTYFECGTDTSNFYKIRQFYRWLPLQVNSSEDFSQYGYLYEHARKVYINYTIEKNGILEQKRAVFTMTSNHIFNLELRNDSLQLIPFTSSPYPDQQSGEE